MADQLEIRILSDGIAGHVNTVRGVAAALGQRTGLPVAEYQLHSNWTERLFRLTGKAPARLWRLDPEPAPGIKPAIVLSAGGRTALANAVLAQKWGCPNAYFSSLRGLPAAGYSACLTVLSDQVTAPNIHLLPVSGSHVTVAQLAQSGAALRAELAAGDAPIWTLLLGGPCAGYAYTPEDWRHLAHALAAAASHAGAQLLLTGSRRTPDAAVALLDQILPPHLVARRHWQPCKAPLARIEALLGAADQVFVSDDSTSMITDALLTRKPVTALYPTIGPDAMARDLAIRAQFEAAGHLRRLPMAAPDGLGDLPWPSQPHTPLPAGAEWAALDVLEPLVIAHINTGAAS